MPDKKGRITPREKAFVKAMQRTDDPTIAATVAGFSQPPRDGWRLMQNPIVAEATREGARAFLRDKAGGIGVAVLASIALDEKQPAGARTTAATNLAKLSGIAIADGEGAKELHEMDGAELARYAAKLRAQADAAENRKAEAARPIIEGQAASVFD